VHAVTSLETEGCDKTIIDAEVDPLDDGTWSMAQLVKRAGLTAELVIRTLVARPTIRSGLFCESLRQVILDRTLGATV
jgi:hypothetical protein